MPDISYRCFRQADEDVKFAATLAHVEELEQDGYVCKLYFDRKAIEILPYNPVLNPPVSLMTDFAYEVSDLTVGVEVVHEETYLWDFGDGTTSTEKNPRHSYASTGTYPVTLATTSNNETTTKTYDVSVQGSSQFVAGWNTVNAEDILLDGDGNPATFPLVTSGVQAEAYAYVSNFNIPAGFTIVKLRTTYQTKSRNTTGTVEEVYNYIQVENDSNFNMIYDRKYFQADDEFVFFNKEYNFYGDLDYIEIITEVEGNDASMVHTLDIKTMEIYLEAI